MRRLEGGSGRGVQLAVDREVHAVAVPVARERVRQPAQLHHRGVEEPDAVLLGERLPRQQLHASRLDAGIVEAEFGDVAQVFPRWKVGAGPGARGSIAVAPGSVIRSRVPLVIG